MLARTDCDAYVRVSPMNLCPCGYQGDPRRVSTCAAGVLIATRSGSQLGPKRKVTSREFVKAEIAGPKGIGSAC